MAKLKRDVDAGLSVVVFADWYNVSVMKKASLHSSDLGSIPLQPSNLPLLCPFGGFPLGGHHIFLEGALVGSYTPLVPGTTQWTPSNNFQGVTPKSEARATRAPTKNPEAADYYSVGRLIAHFLPVNQTLIIG